MVQWEEVIEILMKMKKKKDIIKRKEMITRKRKIRNIQMKRVTKRNGKEKSSTKGKREMRRNMRRNGETSLKMPKSLAEKESGKTITQKEEDQSTATS